MNPDTYLTPVLLLCAECQRPIPATVTTERWIKVADWISPEGTCRECWKEAKDAGSAYENSLQS